MAFEDIERIGAPPKSDVPDDGVRVSTRAAAARGVPVRYIAIQIGGGLARSLVLRGEETTLKLQFGTDRDAGKIAISVDVNAGPFRAKRDKQGRYKLTINAASADGLFALDFPAFTVSPVEVVSREGECPKAVFVASAPMLEVAD